MGEEIIFQITKIDTLTVSIFYLNLHLIRKGPRIILAKHSNQEYRSEERVLPPRRERGLGDKQYPRPELTSFILRPLGTTNFSDSDRNICITI